MQGCRRLMGAILIVLGIRFASTLLKEVQ